jgi:hypothetical protein
MKLQIPKLTGDEIYSSIALLMLASWIPCAYLVPSLAGCLQVVTILYAVGGCLYQEIMRA